MVISQDSLVHLSNLWTLLLHPDCCRQYCWGETGADQWSLFNKKNTFMVWLLNTPAKQTWTISSTEGAGRMVVPWDILPLFGTEMDPQLYTTHQWFFWHSKIPVGSYIRGWGGSRSHLLFFCAPYLNNMHANSLTAQQNIRWQAMPINHRNAWCFVHKTTRWKGRLFTASVGLSTPLLTLPRQVSRFALQGSSLAILPARVTNDRIQIRENRGPWTA